jgi:prepilin-type processing-associated H-X9-DG protein
MYTSEHDYRMPPVDHLVPSMPEVLPLTFFAGRKVDRVGATYQYFDLHVYEKLLVCPATRLPPDRDPKDFLSSWNGDTYRAWDNSLYKGSYGLNGWMPLFGSPGDPQTVWVSCLVKGAGSVPVYSDCRWSIAWPRSTDSPPSSAETPYVWTDVKPVTGPVDMWLCAMDRHQGGINSLFMDWSVRKTGVKELWTLKWAPGFDTAGPWTKAGGVTPEQWPQWMRRFKDY